jgi:hypothetical protein
MFDSFSSLTIRRSFEHGTLCECGHRRLDHRLLDLYAEQDKTESTKNCPNILCICGCVTFKLVSNLRYLEILSGGK